MINSIVANNQYLHLTYFGQNECDVIITKKLKIT